MSQCAIQPGVRFHHLVRRELSERGTRVRRNADAGNSTCNSYANFVVKVLAVENSDGGSRSPTQFLASTGDEVDGRLTMDGLMHGEILYLEDCTHEFDGL